MNFAALVLVELPDFGHALVLEPAAIPAPRQLECLLLPASAGHSALCVRQYAYGEEADLQSQEHSLDVLADKCVQAVCVCRPVFLVENGSCGTRSRLESRSSRSSSPSKPCITWFRCCVASTFPLSRLMPAHLALFLAILYLFACQWVVACYIKVFRPFSSTLLRSVMVPRYWYWCLFFAILNYFGLTFYMDCFQKVFAIFVFFYYLLKVTMYESIKVYNERVEFN